MPIRRTRGVAEVVDVVVVVDDEDEDVLDAVADSIDVEGFDDELTDEMPQLIRRPFL